MSQSSHRLHSHFDEMTGLLYVEGQLDRERALEVSAHVAECPACRTLLHALERESRLLTRAMYEDEESLPTRLLTVPGRAAHPWHWIWAASFGLAAMGVYALYTGFIEPGVQQLEQAGFGGTSLLSLVIFQGAFWKGWQSMLTLFEVLALLTIGGFGLALFRRRLRRGAVVALVFTSLCAVMALPPAASATEVRKGDSVVVAENETIKSDVYLFGNRARIDGTVDGDVFAFASDTAVNGHVTGDVFAFSQSVHVSGKVDGNIRAFSNNITLTGEVGKNVMLFNETSSLERASKIGGSLTGFTKMMNLDGRVGRDIFAFGQQLDISGTVGGEVKARGDSLIIGSSAEISGPVRFEGNHPPDVAAGAKLASPMEFHKMEHKPEYKGAHYYVWHTIWAASFLLFGLVLFLLMPSFSLEAADSAERYGASAGLGVLVLFGVPVAAIIVCFTIVGLFVGISAFLIWIAALFYAQLITGATVGQWLMGRTRDTWPLIGRMAVGFILLRLCSSIPFAGGWIKFIVIVWGLGAVCLALYQRFQPAMSSGAPPVPQQPMGPLPPNTTVGGVQPA